jgi:hypothetical protein
MLIESRYQHLLDYVNGPGHDKLSRSNSNHLLEKLSEHKLISPVKLEIINPDGSIKTQELRSEKPQTLEELRAARLAHFNK